MFKIKITYWIIAVALTLLSSKSVAQSSKERCELTVGLENYTPSEYIQASNQYASLQVDLVHHVFEKLNCDVKFKKANWIELFTLFKAGKIDILQDVSFSKEREKYGFYSTSYRSEKFVLYVRSDEHAKYQNKNLSKLLTNGFRLGLTKGYIYPQNLSRIINSTNSTSIFYAGQTFDNYAKLVKKEIDGFFDEPMVAGFNVKKEDLKGFIKATDIRFIDDSISFLLNRQTIDPQFLEKFNQAISATIESTEFKKKWQYLM